MRNIIDKLLAQFKIFHRAVSVDDVAFKDKLIEEVGKVQRDTRRINLASGQQGEKIASIQGVVESLQRDLSKLHSRLDRETDVRFSESDLLQILDSLDALATVVRFNPSIHKRVADVIEQLLFTAKWQKIAQLGEPYHPQLSTIAAIVTPQTNAQSSCFETGSVFDIVRQGYLRANGEMVREATVVAVTNSSKRSSEEVDSDKDRGDKDRSDKDRVDNDDAFLCS